MNLSLGRRWLWFPALLFTLALDLPGILIRSFLPERSGVTALERIEGNLIWVGELTQNIPLLVGGLLVLSIFFGALWAIATIGQAVLIDGVSAEQTGLQTERIKHWQTGRSLLGRFIAIDTIVLFPLFVNLLLILLLLGGISGSLLITVRGGGPMAISPVVGVLGTVLLPLFCLILPLAIVAFVYRLLAFRFAALQDLSIRESIREVRPFIKENGFYVAILLIMTWAFSYGLNGLMLVVGGGISSLIGTSAGGGVMLIVDLLLILVSLGVATLKNLIISSTWTLSVLKLQEK